jgi:hypothetical protein
VVRWHVSGFRCVQLCFPALVSGGALVESGILAPCLAGACISVGVLMFGFTELLAFVGVGGHAHCVRLHVLLNVGSVSLTTKLSSSRLLNRASL